MNLALKEEIEIKRKHLYEVYDRSDEVTTSGAVLEASQELDKLIVQYVIESQAEKKAKAEREAQAAQELKVSIRIRNDD